MNSQIKSILPSVLFNMLACQLMLCLVPTDFSPEDDRLFGQLVV